jgi:hypothetical protein
MVTWNQDQENKAERWILKKTKHLQSVACDFETKKRVRELN